MNSRLMSSSSAVVALVLLAPWGGTTEAGASPDERAPGKLFSIGREIREAKHSEIHAAAGGVKLSPGRSTRVSVPLPSGGSSEVLLSPSTAKGTGRHVDGAWAGRDFAGNQVVSIRHKGRMAMTVTQKDGKSMLVLPKSDGTYRSIITDKPMDLKGEDTMEAPTLAARSAYPSAGPQAGRSALGTTYKMSEIDMNVVYTSAAVSSLGYTDISAAASTLVAAFNSHASASKLPVRVNLIKVSATRGVEHSTLGDNLVAMRNTGDGRFDDVPSTRSAAGADITAMFATPTDACGIAWIGASRGYQDMVVSTACLSTYTFSHEIGHLLTARHDARMDPTASSAHGWVDPVSRQRDIMSYPTACSELNKTCNQVPLFSNPALTVAGRPFGDHASANSVGAMGTYAPTVASLSASNGTPYVRSWSPAPRANAVPVTSNFKVTFSEPVSGVSKSSMRLITAKGTTVSAAVSYSSTTRTATLNPTYPLKEGRYRLILGGGIKDSSGKYVQTVYGNVGVGKYPLLSSVYPTSGASGVDLGVRPRMVFDEPINVGRGRLELYETDSGERVPAYMGMYGTSGLQVYSVDPLQPNTKYTLVLYPGVMDAAGNERTGEVRRYFTTGS